MSRQRSISGAALLLALASGLAAAEMPIAAPLPSRRDPDERDPRADAERIADAEAKRARKNARRARQFHPEQAA